MLAVDDSRSLMRRLDDSLAVTGGPRGVLSYVCRLRRLDIQLGFIAELERGDGAFGFGHDNGTWPNPAVLKSAFLENLKTLPTLREHIDEIGLSGRMAEGVDQRELDSLITRIRRWGESGISSDNLQQVRDLLRKAINFLPEV